MSRQRPNNHGSYPVNPDNGAYDFQDTYEGLGDHEEADALNSETFGVENVGKDFQFGEPFTSQPSVSSGPSSRLTYARVAANDDDFMKDLWGVPAKHEEEASNRPKETQEKKFLSLEEIEASLMEKPFQTSHEGMSNQKAPVFGGSFPPAYYAGGFVLPQPGFVPPTAQFGAPGMPQFMPMHPNGMLMFGAAGHPNGPMQTDNVFHPQAPNYNQTILPTPAQSNRETIRPKPSENVESVVASSDVRNQNELADFPLLGSHLTSSKRDVSTRSTINNRRSEQDQLVIPAEESKMANEENQAQFSRRQEKVARIMRYSGVMNPKDKDFVTRFQLSQIVTEDPYTEDFYAQVYRVIHPSLTPGALVPFDGHQQPNSVAQAYLDQSGHRLGGRFKRADVALQRMQQQVQKAVSVAKERQSLPHNERVGVLGKISVGSGKKPRQQLSILSKAAQRAKDNESASLHESKDSLTAEDEPNSANKAVKSHTKKDVMAILENIINNLISVENESRSTNKVNVDNLWNSLHVLDQPPPTSAGEPPINPFVQCLNHEKALKILPRLFKFLNREQTLTIVTLIMANLENLSVIKEGSYTTYPDKEVPPKVLKMIELYSLIFCKVLMNAIQDFKFHEIIALLVILIQHNVVSFVSTTKIGLSVLTSLLSRAELIRGEGAISATDLSEWSSCYDELFTALESRIGVIFPPCHGDSQNDYVWQFLATLSLGGKLSHQRIIVDEVRDEIFGVMNRAKAIPNSDMARLHEKQNMLNNLNMYLVVMGLVANENEISELNS